jgi:hypothetical protein
MAYTIQTHADSGNWACPDGTQSLWLVMSKRAAAEHFLEWANTVGRYDDPACASALVWAGNHNDTTDLYPDWRLSLGPRGGVRWEVC